MRTYRWTGLAIAIVVGGQFAAGAQPTKTVRTVQLISMSGGPIASAPGPALPETSAEGEAEMPMAPLEQGAAAHAFRTHDLSQSWVEFEMSNGFRASSSSTAVRETDDDPFAHVGVARVGDAWSAMVPRSTIPIPGWMKSNLAFSAATAVYRPECGPTGYRPAGFLSAAAESRRLGYYAMMRDVACEYGIPAGLFDAMIIRESGYQASIYSPKNAFGLTQLMPSTAAALGVNRYDVEQNLRGGARYLRQQLDRFGQIHLALAAYNAGPGRVRNGVLPRIAETQAYVENVLLNWQRLAGLTINAPANPVAPVMRSPLGVRAANVATF